MDILVVGVCALFVGTACPAPHPPILDAPSTTCQRLARWDGYIGEAARRFAVLPDWIRNVMAQESAGLALWNGKPITSAKGAMGLMQLMPGTWADMRARLYLGDDPYDPHDNILAGTAYLKDMMRRFGTGGFAAYNAGPGRYAAHPEGRATLPKETRHYVAKLRAGATSAPSDALFIVHRDDIAGGLFVRLSSAPLP